VALLSDWPFFLAGSLEFAESVYHAQSPQRSDIAWVTFPEKIKQLKIVRQTDRKKEGRERKEERKEGRKKERRERSKGRTYVQQSQLM